MEGESPHPMKLSKIDSDIIRSFGWALVELERTLYERYLVLSPNHSLTTIDVFRSHLKKMERKGILSSLTLHGQKAYQREKGIEATISKSLPKNPLDEMHLVIGSLKAKQKEETYR